MANEPHPPINESGAEKETSARRSSPQDRQLLKQIGLRIQSDLRTQDKTVEWLAEKIGVARSTLREIIAGRSNPRILTLKVVAEGLGYPDFSEFLRKILS